MRTPPADPEIAPPQWLVPVAWPLSAFYRMVVSARAAAYRAGWMRTERAGVPVVSIGNLTIGGSGKTPMVDYLLGVAHQAGLHPAVLSRGYGRGGRSRLARLRVSDGIPADPALFGDEPCLLARRHPDAPVYVGASRADAARLARVLDGPDLLLLDDGFQHLALARDLNVLLVDAQRGLGNGRVLPMGPLREPLSAFARAHAVVITKANLGDAETVRARLAPLLPAGVPIFRADYRPARLRRLDGKTEVPVDALSGASVSLLCAIAQPESFRRTLTKAGGTVRYALVFPDHHPFTPDDLARIDTRLSGAATDRPEWVTTEKDAVKLQGRLQATDRLWVLEMDVLPEAAAQAFFFDSLRRLTIK